LYGEKQAAYEWFQRLKEILCDHLNFEQLINDECIFIKKYEGELVMMITIHVDDIIVCAKEKQIIEDFKNAFKKHVADIKEYPDVKKYLGLEFDIKPNCIKISQEKYLRDSVESFMKQWQIKENRKQKVPVKPSLNLEEDKEGDELMNLLPIIGKLRYGADCSRPDILLFLSILSSHGRAANRSYCEMLKGGLQYVQNTLNFKLQVGNPTIPLAVHLFAFCDASHNNKFDGCDRIAGMFFMGYNTSPFYSFTKKDKTSSRSPMHAEIKAIERTVHLVLTHRDLIKELGFEQVKATPIFTDSQSAVLLFKELKSPKKIKGLRRAVNNIILAINKGEVKLIFIEGDRNCSDMNTKFLDFLGFDECTKRLKTGFDKEEIDSFLQSKEIAEVTKIVPSAI
jgi:hypothetical protein